MSTKNGLSPISFRPQKAAARENFPRRVFTVLFYITAA